MIIGKGLLANSLKKYDRPEVVFIAAGVSDSKCTDPMSYERETNLVKKIISQYSDKTIVFFSTFSINDPVMATSDYVQCKLKLESYVSNNSKKYLIIRISNLVGNGGNASNVFNFFFNRIVSGTRFKLWRNSRRNLITEEDFARILDYIIEHELKEKLNSILNIVNVESFSVQEIVTSIEEHTGRRAVFDPVDIESVPQPVDEHSRKMFELLNIKRDNYLEHILKKYFSGYQVNQGESSLK